MELTSLFIRVVCLFCILTTSLHAQLDPLMDYNPLGLNAANTGINSSARLGIHATYSQLNIFRNPNNLALLRKSYLTTAFADFNLDSLNMAMQSSPLSIGLGLNVDVAKYGPREFYEGIRLSTALHYAIDAQSTLSAGISAGWIHYHSPETQFPVVDDNGNFVDTSLSYQVNGWIAGGGICFTKRSELLDFKAQLGFETRFYPEDFPFNGIVRSSSTTLSLSANFFHQRRWSFQPILILWNQQNMFQYLLQVRTGLKLGKKQKQQLFLGIGNRQYIFSRLSSSQDWMASVGWEFNRFQFAFSGTTSLLHRVFRVDNSLNLAVNYRF